MQVIYDINLFYQISLLSS